MITVEVIESDLVLSAGGQQLRVALPQPLIEQAKKGTLVLDLIGNAQIGAALVFVGDDIGADGTYNLVSGPKDYKQCVTVTTINPGAIMTRNKQYHAIGIVTTDASTGVNTAAFTIGKPV